jgi:hypothetical protein
MFALPVQIRGHVDNPYIGLLLCVVIPVIFFSGLSLVPLSIFLGWRRMKKGMKQSITDPKLALRRLALVGRMCPGLIEWARTSMLSVEPPLANPEDMAIPV